MEEPALAGLAEVTRMLTELFQKPQSEPEERQIEVPLCLWRLPPSKHPDVPSENPFLLRQELRCGQPEPERMRRSKN